jgi:hypothetical protein
MIVSIEGFVKQEINKAPGYLNPVALCDVLPELLIDRNCQKM